MATQIYAEASESCGDRSKELAFQLKTGNTEIGELTAHIEQKTASISALSTKKEELSASIAADDAELKGATKVPANVNSDVVAKEKELVEIIGTRERATSFLNKERSKARSSFLQGRSASSRRARAGCWLQWCWRVLHEVSKRSLGRATC